MIITPLSLLTALILGVIPALLWLWFWLYEDRLHPEPRTALALTFFTGMCLVLMVIPIQKLFASVLTSQLIIFTGWAFIEEVAKYLGAQLAILKSKVVDEPIDPMIYMITIALGFAALENTLFLMNPLSGTTLAETIFTGNFRFFGATLLHVLCSSIVGAALALSFYIHGYTHRLHVVAGVILAGSLHTLFNLSIITFGGSALFMTFASVWLGIILLLLFFQYIKYYKKTA